MCDGNHSGKQDMYFFSDILRSFHGRASNYTDVFTLRMMLLSLLLCFSFGAAEERNIDPEIFLTKYGYYNPHSYGSDGNLTEALTSYQLYNGLKVTGKIDRETRKDMELPRCGNPDIRITYDASVHKWTKTFLTYTIWNYGNGMTQSAQIAVIDKAFQKWAAKIPLTFVRNRQNVKGDFNIAFYARDHSDGNPFDGKGGTLAHAFYPENGKIHFDDDETWSDKSSTGTNMLWVATHEIGHALGLNHDPNRNAVMYAKYTGYKGDFSLHSNDIYYIQQLY